jgi:hypothetical protein
MWKYSSLASLRHSDASHSGWGYLFSVSLPDRRTKPCGNSALGARLDKRYPANQRHTP